MRHPGLLGAVRAYQHYVRNINRRFPVKNPSLSALTRVGFHMALDHVYALDEDPVPPGQDLDNSAALAFVFAGYHPNPVILANIYLYVHMLGLLRNCFQITSGARLTIFMNRFSRSSRATGPKTRVPIGSPASLTSTAELVSKRM